MLASILYIIFYLIVAIIIIEIIFWVVAMIFPVAVINLRIRGLVYALVLLLVLIYAVKHFSIFIATFFICNKMYI